MACVAVSAPVLWVSARGRRRGGDGAGLDRRGVAGGAGVVLGEARSAIKEDVIEALGHDTMKGVDPRG